MVVVSYHYKNTEKVAHVIAQVLNAPVKTPQQINLDTRARIGIGSGIYGEKHHKRLLDAHAKGTVFSMSSVVEALIPITS